MPKQFWQMKNQGDAAELQLYGVLGEEEWWDDVTSKQFAADVKALRGKPLNVRINSVGGNVFTGNAIYSLLKTHDKKVTVYIDGLAASAASVVAMAGEEVIMPANAMMMIHNPWTVAMGEASDFRKLADDMDKIRDSILTTYENKTGMDRDKIIAMLDDETWLTASEAKDLGFADTILDDVKIAASLGGGSIAVNGEQFSLNRFKNLPVSLVQAAADAPTPEKPQNPTAGTVTAASKTEDVMDIETLKAEHPDLFKQVTDAGVKAGVEQERTRIKAIEDMAMPGHDAMVNKAKFDSGISAEALAVEIVKAEKQRGQKFLDQREDDASDLGNVEQDEPAINAGASADDAKREKWRNAAKRAGGKS